MTQTIESLQFRIAELEAAHAAAVLNNQQLLTLCKRAHEFVRDGLENDGLSSLLEALATPISTEALDAYVAEKVTRPNFRQMREMLRAMRPEN